MNEPSSLPTRFAAIRDCWFTGGSAIALAPDEWQAIIAASRAEESERRLLAIAGQACDLAFRPALPADALRRGDLPRLALPMLPDFLRPLFRKALQQMPAGDPNPVLRLAERRGFSAHPLDWMPAASSENVPDLYAPWLDWAQSRDAETRDEDDELDEASWDAFPPAQRRLRLKAMRAADPERALQLIAARAGQEAAEKRLAIIETLAAGLSENDAPYLQSLAADRSGKVKALAARLLARLRHGSEGLPAEDLAELAAFFEQGHKGILKRVPVVEAKKLKSSAQATRRAALFETFSFVDFAGAFEMTEAELIAAWQFVDDEADASLAQMAAQSAADEFIAPLADRFLAARSTALPILLPRLDRDGERRVMKQFLAQEDIRLLSYIEPGDLVEAGEILSSRAYEAAKEEIRKTPSSIGTLAALAAIATAEAARAVFDDLRITLGLSPSDPALALLRLNFELARVPQGNRINAVSLETRRAFPV